MTTKYVQDGAVLDWTNGTGAAVSSGDIVVMGDTVGIALVDIADGDTGSVQIEGVFTVAKVAGTAINQGDSVDYDASEGAVSKGITTAAGDVTTFGVAAAAAASADTTMQVKLTPGTGTAI